MSLLLTTRGGSSDRVNELEARVAELEARMLSIRFACRAEAMMHRQSGMGWQELFDRPVWSAFKLAGGK